METHEKEFLTWHKPALLQNILCTEALLAELEKHDILSRDEVDSIVSFKFKNTNNIV